MRACVEDYSTLTCIKKKRKKEKKKEKKEEEEEKERKKERKKKRKEKKAWGERERKIRGLISDAVGLAVAGPKIIRKS